jgi:hypothetical protein
VPSVAVEGIRVSDGVTLPVDYVTKTAAILAQRRKGKTYTASVIAEELHRLGMPWVALDPTGAWWGLRSSADGEHAGLSVVVIGGQHGDLPLERDGGAIVADLVLDHPGWYVLDLSLLDSRAAERDFSLAFAKRLYRRKMQAGMDFPLHLFVDEADLFVPQERETGTDTLVLGAFQAIIRRGGLHGLGTTLISQRPALVNKSALTQLDLLILLRLVAGQDQDAVHKAYVKRFGTKAQQDELMGNLATLRIGEAYLLEPGAEPPLFERVQVRERETFNSSATPKAGEKRLEPTVLADVDLEALRERMTGAIERQRLEDPESLRRALAEERKRRADLEAEYRDLSLWADEVGAADDGPTAIDALIATYQVAKSRVGYSCDLIDEARALADGAGRPTISDEQVEALRAAVEPIAVVLNGHLAPPTPVPAPAPTPTPLRPDPEPIPEPAPQPVEPTPAAATPSPSFESPSDLPTGARHLLDTLAAHHPLRLTIGQLALLANRKARGGAWNSAMKTLRESGYVDSDGTVVTLTAEALVALGIPDVRMSAHEIRERWRAALPAAARDLFDHLLAAYPEPVSIDRLAAATGRAARGGSWNSAVATLTRNGLAVRVGDTLAATQEGYGG